MNKGMYKVLLAGLCLTVFMSGCQKVEEPLVEEETVAVAEDVYGEYDDDDVNPNWNVATAENITLADGASTSESTGVTITNDVVTIKDSGTYIISGALTSGQLHVNTATTDTGIVRLILNGVSIQNDATAPIYIEQSQKTTITLASETENMVVDGKNYVYADVTQDEPDAPIFSKDDLTINGSGNLLVQANYNNGIRSKDNLVITGGNITVTAPHNALKAKDSLSILAGTFNLTATGDTIQVNNNEDETKGWIGIDGGTFTLVAGNDGIQAESALEIGAGTFTIKTGVGTSVEDVDPSTKGLKSANALLISGGSFDINAIDDAIHTNNTVTILAGNFNIKSGDDGIHADTLLDISGGNILITESYEGLEAAHIIISGGTIDLTASDDGINAAGGDSVEGGRFQQNVGDYSFVITGGEIIVHADGDGIDSNNIIEQSGGTIIVYGSTSGGDGALDYDGSYTLTGGTIIAAGMQNMAVVPSESSTQVALSIYLNETIDASSTIEVKTSNNEVIASFTAEKTMNHIVISTPEMKQGEEYKIYIDGTEKSIVSLSNIVTAVTEDGMVVVTGGQGMGGPGGGRR